MFMKRREEDNGDDGLPLADAKGLQLLQKMASAFHAVQIFTFISTITHVPDSNHVCGFRRSWNFWGTASAIIYHQAKILTGRWFYKHIYTKPHKISTHAG